MYSDKKVLLIAGGGTLGTYVSSELLKLGCSVDVICLEDKISDNSKLRFFKAYATDEFLNELLDVNRYDGIVNFLHYKNAEDYKKIHPLLIKNTEHLIFLSSYRVYADEEHPITESSPRLYDIVTDKQFLETETYAVPKSICEDYLNNERKGERWTIVRPVISFSHLRLDLLMYSGKDVLNYSDRKEEMILPEFAKNYSAGLDWAGNSGKLIANLLFKEEAIGETFTVYSGHNMTWGDVADTYSDITGVHIRWCSEDEYVQKNKIQLDKCKWMWKFDRHFNRSIDASKILKVTGLKQDDFSTVSDGIKQELKILNWNRK